jgi:hypothetical protein
MREIEIRVMAYCWRQHAWIFLEHCANCKQHLERTEFEDDPDDIDVLHSYCMFDRSDKE